ncbi:flippase-like domain-containing protein [Chitinophagaceae bacterium LB-8]|uniref:Flippase-like domain-containing protein n=1 Tax=Paraflavisolibacter caeni TaxID=2982496 RepID=A0A9X3BHF2_9BACT|nr:lysylphosphatidylglycerol synthase transmembrane domain-containing protein [Paraflavisolibacter caeni]MCU7549502.1 flippase-like domain-containing protein [Paraflavisolibacter caeni]
MENNSNKEGKSKGKLLKLMLKIVITALCFWYISKKIDFSDVWIALLKANWLLLGIAVLLYALSKLLSAFRLNIYFRNISLFISEWDNIKLYWLGMFYNLFLPGAIGGDAYKVIILNKKFKASYKKTTSAVLLDRFSGLLALGVILCAYAIAVINETLVDAVMVSGAFVGVGIFYLAIRSFFKDFIAGFWPTFFWGLAVQLCQVICIYFIMASLGVPLQHEWILIFLLASIVSVFPVSLGGGLGTRELVFAEGARFFHLDPHIGVIISLLFYLCNVLSCVWGAYYIFNDPLKNVDVPAGVADLQPEVSEKGF